MVAVLLTACPSPIIETDDNGDGNSTVKNAAIPTLSLPTGEYEGAQTLTITAGNIPGGSTPFPVFYTFSTDGTDPGAPNANSTKYSGPISILPSDGAQYWIKAVAIQDGYTNSALVSRQFTRNDPNAPNPTFSLEAGTHPGAQTLTITIDNIPGGSTAFPVFYTVTMDGTAPADPNAGSTKYNGPISILPSDGDQYWIKAIAIQNGYSDSEVVSAEYTRDDSLAATPIFDLAEGEHEGAQTLTITIGNIPGGSTPFPVFYTSSTDGTDPGAPNASSTEYSGPISILPSDGAQYRIRAIAIQTGYTNSRIVEAQYTRNDPDAPNPTFSLEAGAHPGAQTLMITVGNIPGGSTPFPVFYTFTTDGTDPGAPDASSTPYTGEINILPINGNEYWIKAIAIQVGYTNSEIVSAQYTRNDSVAPGPTFNLAEGNFASMQALTITAGNIPGGSTPFSVFYTFTTDGTDPSAPNASSTKYSGPISILPSDDSQYRIKAITIQTGYINSNVVSAEYTRRTAPSPTFNLAEGNFASMQALTITAGSLPDGVTPFSVRYTFSTDGTAPPDPNAGSDQYASAIDILTGNESQYWIKAITIQTGYNNSRIVSAEYTRGDPDGDNHFSSADVDDDNDGLIEIHNLDMLAAVNNDLRGQTLVLTVGTPDITGAPTSPSAACTTATADGVFLCGYELAANLDFAVAGDYANNTVNATWCPDSTGGTCTGTTGQAGFPGIGGADGTSPFLGLFKGNAHTISNLYSRRSGNVGLFNTLGATAELRTVGLVNAAMYGSTGADKIGTLVGLLQDGGTVSASYSLGGSVDPLSDNVTGAADGVGGLVGESHGTIQFSHSTSTVSAGTGNDARVGGLVGILDGGDILASFATGDISTQTTSTATTNGIQAGGLIGRVNTGGTNNTNGHIQITASYARGSVSASRRGANYLGGLIGHTKFYHKGITASYASGAITLENVNAGAGVSYISELVGLGYDAPGGGVSSNVGSVIASYGFASIATGTGVRNITRPVPDIPIGVSNASDLIATNAGASWNRASDLTHGAWDFGTTSQAPALVYADYDGDGTEYSCDNFPAKVPGTDITINCEEGTTLIGGPAAQGR